MIRRESFAEGFNMVPLAENGSLSDTPYLRLFSVDIPQLVEGSLHGGHVWLGDYVSG